MHSFRVFSIVVSTVAALAAAAPQLLPVGGALDTSHAYIKSDTSKGDVRSPCPALNVLSNYGYL
jgi:hypothetical protein